MKRTMSDLDRKLRDGPPDDHDIGSWASYSGMVKWCDSFRLAKDTVYKVGKAIASYASHNLKKLSLAC